MKELKLSTLRFKMRSYRPKRSLISTIGPRSSSLIIARRKLKRRKKGNPDSFKSRELLGKLREYARDTSTSRRSVRRITR